MPEPKSVGVTVCREMAATPGRVAAVMFDAAREPDWMKAVKSAGWEDPELRVGARAWQKGRFLGKEISWTTEVTEYKPGHLLAMRIEGGPFRGTVRYAIEPSNAGSRVSVRNEGVPTAFGWMPRWLIEAAMRAAMGSDLGRLQRLVESPNRTGVA
jgi:uncharacterized membrane protein